MANESNAVRTGNTLASLGGLSTILGLITIEDGTWQIVALTLGVVLALWGALLIQRAKKKEKS